LQGSQKISQKVNPTILARMKNGTVSKEKNPGKNREKGGMREKKKGTKKKQFQN